MKNSIVIKIDTSSNKFLYSILQDYSKKQI